jgi:hypothetical protein
MMVRCSISERCGISASDSASLREGLWNRYFRVVAASPGGVADLAHLTFQEPLPETADELCAVAADLKVEASDIRLGAQATAMATA